MGQATSGGQQRVAPETSETARGRQPDESVNGLLGISAEGSIVINSRMRRRFSRWYSPVSSWCRHRARSHWAAELQKELGSSGRLSVSTKDMQERLRLEVWMRMMMPEFCCFLILLCVLIGTLNHEVSVGNVYSIREMISTHFELESLQEVSTFQGVYEWLYHHVEAAERLDPLNTDEYIDAYVLNDSQYVSLVQQKAYYEAITIVMPPVVATARADRIRCEGFADNDFDRIYCLRRIERAGWDPERVTLTSVEGNVEVFEDNGQQQDRESPWGSTLLTCVDRSSDNETMPWYFGAEYGLTPLSISGKQFFGDATISKRDILAYMGYDMHSNSTTVDCLLATLDNVADVCEYTGKTWLDHQTKAVRVRTFFYTPVMELFTLLDVEILVSQTGALVPSSRVHTFQQLTHTYRYPVWQLLMGLQVVTLFFQFVFMARRMVKRSHYRATFTNTVPARTMTEVFSDVGCVCLHLFYLVYALMRSSRNQFGSNVWEILEKLDNNLGEVSSVDVADELAEYIWQSETVTVVNFVLILWSIMQLINYLSVHPRLGLLWNTIAKVMDELLHFSLVFALFLFMLCMLGTLSFGSHLEDFSSLSKTLATGIFWALGQFEQGNESNLPTWNLRALYWVWVITYLVVMFLFLLNFLLAIVVEGYGAAIKVYQDMVCEENFLEDFWNLIWFQVHFRLFRWPSRTTLLQQLVRLPQCQEAFTAEDIMPAFEFVTAEERKAEATRFLMLYCKWMPQLKKKQSCTARTEDAPPPTPVRQPGTLTAEERLEQLVLEQPSHLRTGLEEVRQMKAALASLWLLEDAHYHGVERSPRSPALPAPPAPIAALDGPPGPSPELAQHVPVPTFGRKQGAAKRQPDPEPEELS
mmetsp:Transcript_45757/g.106243  ORF Transcript_45757/g.106243 Transcript_45757/m.106243 type:complete len:869 (+) Transcript_45757:79-2685(+)